MKAIALILCWPLMVFAHPFMERHGEGWFWYENPSEKMKAPIQPIPVSPFDPTETMLALQKRVEASLNLAILSPTLDNLRNYAEHYFEVIRRGQRFTDAYKVMLLNTPQYDYSLKFPTSHLVQPLFERRKKQFSEDKIREFTKQHGLFFFLAGGCSYCHAFAPVVKHFVDKYATAVIPISLDGGAVPPFTKVLPDNGTASRLNVTRLPALFAVNPRTKQVIPLANGVLSLSELETNILNILEVQHE